MATYNGERHIKEQLDSLARQSHLPLELVVTGRRLDQTRLRPSSRISLKPRPSPCAFTETSDGWATSRIVSTRPRSVLLSGSRFATRMRRLGGPQIVDPLRHDFASSGCITGSARFCERYVACLPRRSVERLAHLDLCYIEDLARYAEQNDWLDRRNLDDGIWMPCALFNFGHAPIARALCDETTNTQPSSKHAQPP
jgi:hypothetical protein